MQVMDMGSSALVIALPFACVLGLLASVTASTLGKGPVTASALGKNWTGRCCLRLKPDVCVSFLSVSSVCVCCVFLPSSQELD